MVRTGADWEENGFGARESESVSLRLAIYRRLPRLGSQASQADEHTLYERGPMRVYRFPLVHQKRRVREEGGEILGERLLTSAWCPPSGFQPSARTHYSAQVTGALVLMTV